MMKTYTCPICGKVHNLEALIKCAESKKTEEKQKLSDSIEMDIQTIARDINNYYKKLVDKISCYNMRVNDFGNLSGLGGKTYERYDIQIKAVSNVNGVLISEIVPNCHLGEKPKQYRDCDFDKAYQTADEEITAVKSAVKYAFDF